MSVNHPGAEQAGQSNRQKGDSAVSLCGLQISGTMPAIFQVVPGTMH